MLADILKWAKPVAIANPIQQQEVVQETINEKTSWETGFWSWLKKSFWETANAAMAWISSPSPSDYLTDPIIAKDKLKYAVTPLGLAPFMATTITNLFKKNTWVNKAWLSDVSWDDLEYIKSLDKQSAFNYLNKKWLVVDAAKTQTALNDYYWAREKNIKRYGLDKIEPPKSIFSNKEESLLKLTKQKAFDNASWLWLSELASARTVQLMEDWFRSTIQWPKMSLNDIEDKYNKLRDQWALNPEAESIYKNTKDVYNKALPRISEIAIMQSKNVWKDNENAEDLVIKELKEKWFNNVNEYIYQDSKEVLWTNKSLADYMKWQSASIDLLYQFNKKDWLWYSNTNYWYDFWNKWDEAFHTIWAVTALIWTNLNSWAQKIFSWTNALWLGWIVAGAKYWVWDLKMWTYAYTEEWTWMYGRWLAKWADFLPEAASFAVWTKGVDKLLRVGKLWSYLWWTSMEGWIAYKMLTWLKLSPQRALQWERAIKNVAYTALNTIPKELVVGTVWNTRDPESWSQEQEYRAMFDAWIWGVMWVWRQFKDIKRINSIFQTPEEWKAFLEKMKIESPNLPQEELEYFTMFHPTVMKTFETLNNATIAKWIERWDNLILWMKPEDWNVNSKKAYASAKVRDLYLKNAWQLTDADRNLMANMQKLIKDDKINLADVVKLDRNIPWKFTFAWQTSNIKTKVDQFQAALDWEYQKPIDDLFDWEGWKPDSVINKQQLDRMQSNIETKWVFKDLDKWIDITNKDWVKEFRPYIKETDEWYALTREGYEYLWIVDKRTRVDDIIRSDDWIDVADALKIARDNGAEISDSTISLIQDTDLVDKLISISWC